MYKSFTHNFFPVRHWNLLLLDSKAAESYACETKQSIKLSSKEFQSVMVVINW